MWSTIITTCLPLIASLASFYIKRFISGDAEKEKAQAAFDAWANSHKKDGNASAQQHSDYQSQLDDLNKKKDE